MKCQNKQSGFSAVEIILVVTFIGIIGFIGFTVWKNQNKTAPTASPSQEAKTTAPQAELSEEPPQEIITGSSYTSTNKKYKLDLPDGWKFEADFETDYTGTIGLDNMTYTAGTPAVVTRNTLYGRGGPTSAAFDVGYVEDDSLSEYFSTFTSSGTTKTKDGLTVQKFYKKYTTEEDLAPPIGSQAYGYVIKKDGRTLIAHYQLTPGDPDQLSRVETIVKTIELL